MKKKITILLAVFFAAFNSKAAISFYNISATPSTTSAVITFSISNSTAPFNTNMNIFYDTISTSLNNDLGNVIFSGSSVVNTTRTIYGLLPGTKYFYQLKSGLVRSAIDSFTTTGTLPLNIISFTATKKENTALLNWTSENEINVSNFNIQHSINGKDFETIGTVNAGKNNYSFVVLISLSNIQFANNYYRLEIKDKDGKTQYSKVIVVGNNNTIDIIKVYPTIATSVVNIAFESNEKQNISFKILDTKGYVVDTKNIQVVNGANLLSYDCSKFCNGLYFINFSGDNGFTKTEKFYKQ